tara:strand:- start:876 stop:1532 length:657 start_codon:yes stop_codon:yes gene_type:complete
MSQLIFKFPFRTRYFKEDYYVSSNNFSAYKLIEGWPNWPDRWVNIFGPSGSGKSHLSKILEKKIGDVKFLNAKDVTNDLLPDLEILKCVIIDNYNQNIDENLFYTILNHSKQLNTFIVINSLIPIKDMKLNLVDLKSRVGSFIDIGIELPTDELLRVIISKSFSDKQIIISPKVSEYIIKNIDRSYEKITKFIKKIDDLSLSSGKSININLIKKVINE